MKDCEDRQLNFRSTAVWRSLFERLDVPRPVWTEIVTRGWAAATRLQIFFKLFQRLVDALAVGLSDTAIAPTSAPKETDLGR